MDQQTPSLDDSTALQPRRLILALTALITISATLDITGEYFGPRILVYFFKPLTTALIITIALTAGTPAWKHYRGLIVAGLCCSLVGDSLLMLPSDQFVAGLVSFLIAHLFYIAAFRSAFAGLASVCVAAACAVYGGLMLWILSPRLEQMKLAVAIYMLVILTMAWRALNRWAANRGRREALAAAGAILFVASDSMIAINRFRGRFQLAELLILATYFAAQWLIALSVA